MAGIVAHLENLDRALDEASRVAFRDDEVPDLADAEIAALLEISGRIQKRIEGLQIEATGQVVERSTPLREDKLTAKYGWSRPSDLVRVLTRTEMRDANRLVRVAKLLHRTRSMTSGEFLPARYPELRETMTTGVIGVAGLLAAMEPLEQSAKRILDDARLAADQQLADLARGRASTDGDTAPQRPLPVPEDLRILARVLVAYLDPDGAGPADEVATRTRRFSLGRERQGTVPVRGNLLPEVAAQLQLLFDSILNPRVDGPADPTAGVQFRENRETDAADDADDVEALLADRRTRGQKLHDAFAMVVNAAARSDQFPHLGGAAPTLVVAATAEDLAAGTGWAQAVHSGDLLPTRVAAQIGCAGGIQRVLFDENGRICALGTSARIFNALQRRAIALRDGGCVIPSCTVPASWCEVHHVDEHADGGATHTDNGALLCWWHHRNLHLSEWRIRMNRGVPEIRGPQWWDREQRWHPARGCRPRRRRRTHA